RAREGREGLLVVIGGDGPVRGDLEGGAEWIGAVDVGFEAEAGGGERQHAAELAAAENADGGIEGQGGGHGAAVISPALPASPARGEVPLRGCGGMVLAIFARMLRDLPALLRAIGLEPLTQLVVAQGQHGGGEEGGVGGAGLADGERADRDAGG